MQQSECKLIERLNEMSFLKEEFIMPYKYKKLVIHRSSYKTRGWGIRWRPIDHREAICLLHRDNLV